MTLLRRAPRTEALRVGLDRRTEAPVALAGSMGAAGTVYTRRLGMPPGAQAGATRKRGSEERPAPAQAERAAGALTAEGEAARRERAARAPALRARAQVQG